MIKKYYSILDKIAGLKPTLSQQYHQSTQFNKFASSPRKWPDDWKKTFYKGYPRFEAIQLNKPSKLVMPFQSVLEQRHSTRTFSNEPISGQKIGDLLHYSAGENPNRKGRDINYRYYASGGARYPFEVYTIIRNSTDIDAGTYHYYIPNHLLERLPSKKVSDSFIKKAFGQPYWGNASAFIVVSAIFSRTQVKYHERGYRIVLMDLGHLSQNIYLASAALNIGCCEINGYNDFMFNDLLDLDGWRECVLIVFALGNIP